MINRHEFQKSEAHMANLAEFLRQPEMELAIKIVQAEAVKPLPSPIPNVSYAEMVAAHGAEATGWMNGIKALLSLAKKPSPQHQPDQVKIYSAAAKRMLVDSGIYSPEEVRQYEESLHGT